LLTLHIEQIWPTHKWLCGKDGFSFPPLTPLDISDLEVIRTRTYHVSVIEPTYPTWEAYLLVKDLFRGRWEVRLVLPSLSRPPISVIHDFPLPQDLLALLTAKTTSLAPAHYALLLSSAHLYILQHQDDLPTIPDPWRSTSMPLNLILTNSTVITAADKAAALAALQPFLLQKHIFNTLYAWRPREPFPEALTLEMYHLAFQRAKDEAKRSTLEPVLKSQVVLFMEIEEMNLPRTLKELRFE
jgi:hypothetical protein